MTMLKTAALHPSTPPLHQIPQVVIPVFSSTQLRMTALNRFVVSVYLVINCMGSLQSSIIMNIKSV